MNRVSLLSCSALVACVAVVGTSACAQDIREYNVPAGALGDALQQYATQSDQQLFYSGSLVAGLQTQGLRGRFSSSDALNRLVSGTGLAWSRTDAGVIVLRKEGRAKNAEGATVVDDVIVTGTLLKSSGDLASPVVILDRDALDRRGFGTVAETLTSLPQNYAGSATPLVQAAGSDVGASNDVYATGINLRGLGPASTLVLVNGRRMAGTGSRAEFADVSALPSAAVQRVDVLLDGASALYGSDAIAGVVNVIMRRSFDGQETRMRASVAQGGGEDLIFSHLAGRTWSNGAAYLSYEYQTVNGLSSLDRPYTVDGDLRPFGGTDHRRFYSGPGNIVAFVGGAYVTQFAIRPNASGTAQGPADFAAGAENREANSLGVDLLPSLERHSAYGRFSQSLGDRLEITGDVRYNRRDHDVATAASGGVVTVTNANPWFVSPTGASSHTIAYSFARDLGTARSRGRSESLGFTLGGRFDLTSTWSVEAYVAGAEERGDFGNSNRINSRFLAEALGNIPDDPATPYRAAVDGYYNIFGDGNANSREVLDFIGSGGSRVRNRSRASSANLLAQGPILRIPGGEVAIALGAQFRKESFETGGESFISGVTPILRATPRRERSIVAAFVEARIPLVGADNARPGLRSLDLSLAGRIEDYDDFGTTTNPKVGLVWSPVKNLGLRASWGTSFRAGALPQLFDPMGVSPLFLSGENGANILTLQLNGGNADLKPETAETLTLGFDYRASAGATFSFNYFDTRFTDRIGRPLTENARAALTDPAARPFVTFVNPSSNPADLALIDSYSALPGFSGLYPTNSYGAIVDGRWVNTGAVRVRGLDASGRYSRSFGAGMLSLDASASWILNYETRPTPTAPVREVAGLISYPVEFRARSGVTWVWADIDLALHWTHVAAYKDHLGTRIDAFNTLDARFGWSIGGDGPASGLRLALGVENLLDEDPPFYDAPTGFGFDAGQASLLGRAVSLQLIKRW
ncbi:outer membrane receptor protein involved in Fe transport [Brevundimonas bullata]|uniref:Outer membrane receptor protein involved in Fe transport n=1 Tax=Brevundimonas bullata TaxID=13160 RepID=A0A7W7IRT7_9CAUL|nr:TonB-dependent receptor [Brevundimonas bullata]MBB4799062.1 outer membrane receptor protein involved in Fe transport [Brevundimonas bullata]MBB6384243.1 outer membrane receptor protein involved in Fe transport [Brevundimonas bullata]